MSAKVRIEQLETRSGHPNTRRTTRRIAGTVATVRTAGGARSRARIRDVSIFGCSIVTEADWLRTGIFVTIQLSAEWSIQAIVRWARDGIGGVEFLRAISEADARNIAGD
ncbi:MAG: PilZ domain-containing protein [Novosphingobium sp.]